LKISYDLTKLQKFKGGNFLRHSVDTPSSLLACPINSSQSIRTVNPEKLSGAQSEIWTRSRCRWPLTHSAYCWHQG